MIETSHPEIAEIDWIDDAFYMEQTKFLWKSVLKNGKDFLFGMNREDVLQITRWHLKCEQEGTLHLYTRVVGNAVVDGKL